MSLREVREVYGERWLEFTRLVVRHLDDGRKRLVTHDLEFEHERPASSVLPRAGAAVNDVIVAIEGRMRHFRRRRITRRGSLWRELEGDFLAASAVVHGVCAALCFAVAVLLEDDDDLSSDGLAAPSSCLTTLQREFLTTARERLEEKTERFLAQAESMFITGRRLVVAALPSTESASVGQ